MTYREAAETTYRELGWSEDRIKKALAFSDRSHPASIPSTNKTIPPGMERTVIDELKMVTRLPQEKINQLYEQAVKSVMKNSAKN